MTFTRSRRSAMIDWMDEHLGRDFQMAPHQRAVMEEIIRGQRFAENYGSPVKARPRLQPFGFGPDYVLVWTDELTKKPKDYYQSDMWLANQARLRRHLETWSAT